jgi:hypothetical protein
MSFELASTTEVKLVHVNHRYEFHGEDKVLAVDLNFEWETVNDNLDLLDPKLRTSLFCNAAATEGQETLPEVLKVLPNLRCPHLNGGKFKYRGNDKFKGYAFELDYGLGDELANIAFDDCAVGKHEIEVKEGGTSILKWQISYAGDKITQETLFKLVEHEGEKAFITLKAPAQLVLVKGGKSKGPATIDDQSGDLLAEGGDEGGDEGEEVDAEDEPLTAMKRAHGGGE